MRRKPNIHSVANNQGKNIVCVAQNDDQIEVIINGTLKVMNLVHVTHIIAHALYPIALDSNLNIFMTENIYLSNFRCR